MWTAREQRTNGTMSDAVQWNGVFRNTFLSDTHAKLFVTFFMACHSLSDASGYYDRPQYEIGNSLIAKSMCTIRYKRTITAMGYMCECMTHTYTPFTLVIKIRSVSEYVFLTRNMLLPAVNIGI